MATFCKNAGSGFVFPSPITANVGVGKVPISHVFGLLNIGYLSYFSAIYNLLNRIVKTRVAQYVAYYHM